MLSYWATGAFLFLDLQGIKLGGQTVEWQIPALISFCIFGGLVLWHILSLNQQIHSPENQIDVTIRPDPLIINNVSKWYELTSFSDIPGRYSTYTHLFLDIRSTDVSPRTINNIYLEIRTARHLFWRWYTLPVLLQRRVLTVPPMRVDGDINWYKRQFPERVDWVISAAGGTITYRVSFERTWDESRDNLPPPPKQYDLFLVAEVGGRQHKRRWDVVKEATSQ